MKGKGLTGSALIASVLLITLGAFGCSSEDGDTYTQAQLDAQLDRAEEQAREEGEADGYRRGLAQGELRALKRAGMGGADGWWSVRMKGGELPRFRYYANPIEMNRAIHLCDFDPSALCSVDPRTGESLSENGGETP